MSDRFLNSFENYWSAFFGENIPFEEKQQRIAIAKQDIKQTIEDIKKKLINMSLEQETKII